MRPQKNLVKFAQMRAGGKAMSWFRKSGISKWISLCKESSRLNHEEEIDTAAILKTLDKVLVQVNCIVDGNTKRNERLTKIEQQLNRIEKNQ
jgi:hypothetical protein